jgi:FtsP/CotA-like multicopper oxidase with cupredoxin domain
MTMGMGGMMRGMMMSGGMGMHGINGRAFDMERTDEEVRLGDVEIWEVSGEMMAHPFHIHGVNFEVLSRNGAVPSQRDQGLRDTVVAQEPVELLVQFTQPAVAAPFMYHCHLLEHEDNGMMGQFVVR